MSSESIRYISYDAKCLMNAAKICSQGDCCLGKCPFLIAGENCQDYLLSAMHNMCKVLINMVAYDEKTMIAMRNGEQINKRELFKNHDTLNKSLEMMLTRVICDDDDIEGI